MFDLLNKKRTPKCDEDINPHHWSILNMKRNMVNYIPFIPLEEEEMKTNPINVLALAPPQFGTKFAGGKISFTKLY